MDLHRASNISYGEAKTSTELAAGLVSTPCRPGRSKHSCSVQLSLNAGSLNSGTSQKEHVSRKICQTPRRKLSIISKLRAKLQGAGCARSEHMNSNGPSVSDHREIIRTPVVTFPTSHELGGSYYFPANRDLAAYKGPLHVSQAELPVDSVHELSCMHNGSVAKISEKPDSRQNGVSKACLPSLSITQASIVSVLSSQWDSSGSDRQTSWQISQPSIASGFTPETSLSETDWGRGEFVYGASYDNVVSPKEPLILTPHLTIPPAVFVDEQITDSPTSVDMAKFPLQRGMAELDVACRPWWIPQENRYEETETLSSYPSKRQQQLEPEELILSSPSLLDLLQSPDSQLHSDLNDTPLSHYATMEPVTEIIDSLPSRFLEACRRYARSISDK